MKKERIIFIISLVMMLLATSISVYATSCLYNSSDVSYTAPSGSGLSANVQDSLTEVYGHCTDYTEIRAMIYPVGSIYLSVTDDTVAKVEDRFGGTWEAFGQGRTLVGMGSNGTTNYTTVAATGGQETINLSHSHTVNSHTHTMAHTHGLSAGYAQIHLGGADWRARSITAGTKWNGNAHYSGTNDNSSWSNLSGAVGLGGSTDASSAANTGAASPGTDSKLSATQSIMQPYITVYMYKRTS